MNAETEIRAALAAVVDHRKQYDDLTKRVSHADAVAVSRVFRAAVSQGNIAALLAELDARQAKIDLLQKDAGRLAFVCGGLVYLERDNDSGTLYAEIAGSDRTGYENTNDFLNDIDTAMALPKGSVFRHDAVCSEGDKSLYVGVYNPVNLSALFLEIDARQAKIDLLQKDADRLAFICTSLVYLELDNFLSAIEAAMAQSKAGGL